MVKLSGKFIKSKEVNEGEKVKFLNEGEWVQNDKYNYPDGNPKVDFVIKVQHGEEEKSMRLSKLNRDELIYQFGDETSEWIGKEATITLDTAIIAGKRQKMIVLKVENGKPPKEEEVAWDGD